MKMVVKNPGLGASQMDRSISGIKFIIFCLNVILWVSHFTKLVIHFGYIIVSH